MNQLKVFMPDCIWVAVEEFAKRTSSTKVMVYWNSVEDDLCLETLEYERAKCGTTENWAWLDFMNDPRNAEEIKIYNFGSSVKRATSHILFDLTDRTLWVRNS